MLRAPLHRALSLPNLRQLSPALRNLSTTSAQLEKIEVFVDDKPVMVEPGTTVLQVKIILLSFHLFSNLHIVLPI